MAKKKCTKCNGSGHRHVPVHPTEDTYRPWAPEKLVPCFYCNGKGKVNEKDRNRKRSG